MSTLRTTRGDTTTYRFPCVDADGAPVDLTPVVAGLADLHVRRDGELVLALSLGHGLSVVEPPALGLLDLTLLPEDTEGLAGDYRWDLQLTAGGQRFTVDSGVFMVKTDLTQ